MAKKSLIFFLSLLLIVPAFIFSVSAEMSEDVDYMMNPGKLIVENGVAGVVYNGGVGSLRNTSFEFLPNFAIQDGVAVYQHGARVADIRLPQEAPLFTYGDNIITKVSTSFRSLGRFADLPSYNTVHFNFWQIWNANGLQNAAYNISQFKINGQVIPRNNYVFASSSAGGYTSVYSFAVDLSDEVSTLVSNDKTVPYSNIELVFTVNWENSEPMTITESFSIYTRLTDLTYTNLELNEALLEAQRQTELLGDIADRLDNIDQKFDDAMQEHDNQQKQEYQQQGNDQSSAIGNNMPDTNSVVNAFSSFVGAISSTDRVSYFPTPALKIPAIDGVISKEVVLLEAGQVNLSEYIAMVPAEILTLIQIVFSLALCVFFVKEMQRAIDLVMKGGE